MKRSCLPTRLPPCLRPGDTLGIVHPAGPVQDYKSFENGLQMLRDLGLRIRWQAPDGSGSDYLAADDQRRLHELHSLWADDAIKAIMAARGGYGCLRIMPGLDLELIRKNPKWLIGFSDLTVLLNGIFAETGLIGLHGPVVTSLPRTDPDSLERFRAMLAGEFPPFEDISGLEILSPGRQQQAGRLVGGNLTTLTHLIGTPWLPDLSGSILFLEDTAEQPYKLDRMLTQLVACGILENLAGLILGDFDPGHGDRLEMIRLNEQVWKRVLELSRGSSYPIWGGFPIGHQQRNSPLPIGMEAFMDSGSGTMEFIFAP